MICPNCKGIGWILFFKDAPSPPYLPDKKLEYGVKCDCAEERGNARKHD